MDDSGHELLKGFLLVSLRKYLAEFILSLAFCMASDVH